MADLLVYRAEGRAVLDGTDLYGFRVTEWNLPATYPPFAALLFVPAAVLPLAPLKAAFAAGSVPLLALLVHLSLRLTGVRPAPRDVSHAAGQGADGREAPRGAGHETPAAAGRDGLAGGEVPRAGHRGAAPGDAGGLPAEAATGDATAADGPAAHAARGTRRLPRPAYAALVLAATALALWLEPVFQTVLFGQINLVLAGLVLWDLTRPDGARGKGLALGIAAGIKLTPAIFAVYLLLTGRVRAAFTALAGFAGSVLLGAAVLPGASVEFWTRRVFETGRVGKAWIVDNQSLQGLSARLLHTEEPGLLWQAAALVTAVAGLLLARHAWRARRDEAWGVVLTALTALLISPISWSHHWVWCVALIALLAREAGPRTAVCVAVLFTARSLWLVPSEGDLDLRLTWWQQVPASPYPVLALGVLGFAAWRLRPARGTAPAGPGGTAAPAGEPVRAVGPGRPVDPVGCGAPGEGPPEPAVRPGARAFLPGQSARRGPMAAPAPHDPAAPHDPQAPHGPPAGDESRAAGGPDGGRAGEPAGGAARGPAAGAPPAAPSQTSSPAGSSDASTMR
ncbi:DUF2029 domain-containing protein [Streptomyces sp. PLAI1-29]|uniref:DUF2029 domain-containing protein n=1 Tax=Streptomyces zingiberis TaxID=2053010 RepID=A0ABX1BUR9_9ACTN|nr:glycosyltransferase 87 family protein [Streptomyces zingiberis]NJP99972.1 DUF2029 domain-containing protein [Streptomyces zingiberis]